MNARTLKRFVDASAFLERWSRAELGRHVLSARDAAGVTVVAFVRGARGDVERARAGGRSEIEATIALVVAIEQIEHGSELAFLRTEVARLSEIVSVSELRAARDPETLFDGLYNLRARS